jgi:sec-independent protein translocase protein TatC
MAMRKSKNKPATRQSQRQLRRQAEAPEKIPFIAHIHELRKRLFFIALAIGIGTGVAYSIQQPLTKWLLQPAGNQQFIYTTPGGGFDFQLRLCLYAGIALAIPAIIFQILKYIHPLLRNESRRFMGWLMVWSSILALGGICFGYFFGLPAATHFLLQNFSSDRIEALITIQSYLAFVMTYLLGAALLFQLPLILLLINRVKPLPPKKLFRNQRWFILGAFIAGAVLSPTPDIRSQLMLSGPIILMYEGSILLIWLINRKYRRPAKVVELLHQDNETQSERLASFAKARAEWRKQMQAGQVAGSAPSRPVTASLGTPQRPRQYAQDFRRPASLGQQETQIQ